MLTNIEDVQSNFTYINGIKRIETKNSEGRNNSYLLLDCNIGKINFATLLKTTTSKYRNWVIQYCNNDDNKNNYVYTPTLCPVSIQRVAGFIKEKSDNEVLNYCPEFFGLHSIPWAVSVEEKNKSISFICDCSQDDMEPIEELVIVNGFVSAEKDYLYSANARAKKIKINYDNIEFTYELNDCANYQIIKLPKEIQAKRKTLINLEILDIYEGEKFQDIVISAIMFPELHIKKK